MLQRFSAEKYPWVIEVDPEGDKRLGIEVRHIKSGNDGDVCNSAITHELLHVDRPVYCLDIGVDEGWWSLFVADINPGATIHAFEPNPKSYKALIPFLKYTPQVNLHNVAISDKEGSLRFVCENGQSNSRDDSAENSIEVRCVSPDQYVKNKAIDLIKIDTEGHDLVILKSLHPYLTNIKAIIFECSVYWYGKTKEECIQKTIDELRFLRQHYSYMYMLNRRGEPVLFSIEMDDIDKFVVFSYDHHFQSDILVSKIPIQTIPSAPFR